MSKLSEISEFIGQFRTALVSGAFKKLTLAGYSGDVPELKNIYVREVKIKQEKKLSFTYRYKTRDIVKNFDLEEGMALVGHHVEGGFQSATLFSTEVDLVLQLKNHRLSLKQLPPSLTAKKGVELSHDKAKHRKVGTLGKQYLVDLKLTDEKGNVFQNAQDKYKQINHFIEILSPIIKDLPDGAIKKVMDMGAGKGYLTFALYDYLQNELKQNVEITGVEYRRDLVDLCNQISKDAGFSTLTFEQGTIGEYKEDRFDMLIALHACDTATDDAIYKGIQAGAQLIVTAPCCHKQIRKEITAGKVSNELDFLTRHGIFLERQAEMVTDGLRALIMEYFGYKTKIMQFISDAHTPKNVLIVGAKKEVNLQAKAQVLSKIKLTKAYFGITKHHLEVLSGL